MDKLLEKWANTENQPESLEHTMFILRNYLYLWNNTLSVDPKHYIIDNREALIASMTEKIIKEKCQYLVNMIQSYEKFLDKNESSQKIAGDLEFMATTLYAITEQCRNHLDTCKYFIENATEKFFDTVFKYNHSHAVGLSLVTNLSSIKDFYNKEDFQNILEKHLDNIFSVKDADLIKPNFADLYVILKMVYENESFYLFNVRAKEALSVNKEFQLRIWEKFVSNEQNFMPKNKDRNQLFFTFYFMLQTKPNILENVYDIDPTTEITFAEEWVKVQFENIPFITEDMKQDLVLMVCFHKKLSEDNKHMYLEHIFKDFPTPFWSTIGNLRLGASMEDRKIAYEKVNWEYLTNTLEDLMAGKETDDLKYFNIGELVEIIFVQPVYISDQDDKIVQIAKNLIGIFLYNNNRATLKCSSL